MIIVVADQQARVRYSLRILLEQQVGWAVGGEAADCQNLFELLYAAPPDLLLIDWDLPGLPPENLLQNLREQFPKMLVLSMSGRQELGPLALQSGANAFACKTESPLKLLYLIQGLFA